MKIQFFGNETFGAFGKDAKVIFNPADNFAEKNIDFITNSNGKTPQGIDAKKMLTLPGEYEISNVLIKSIAQKTGNNVIFKTILDELSIVYCGKMTETPGKDLLEELGEDIDVLILNISEEFPAKKVKDFLETIEPRIGFIGGDSSKFAEIRGILQMSNAEENPLKISRSTLSEDRSEYYILNI